MKLFSIKFLDPNEMLLGLRLTNGVATMDDNVMTILPNDDEQEGTPVNMIELGIGILTITIIF